MHGASCCYILKIPEQAGEPSKLVEANADCPVVGGYAHDNVQNSPIRFVFLSFPACNSQSDQDITKAEKVSCITYSVKDFSFNNYR